MHGRLPNAVLLSPGESNENKLARGWLAVLAGVVAVALTFAALIGMGNSAANAATPGSITTTVITGGEKYDGIPVVKEGETLTMRVTYKDSAGAGSSVSIDLGANVTLGDVPAGNEAVESITKDPQNPNAVIVKFKDPWPAGVDQGLFDLVFTVNDVEGSSKDTIDWTVDGDPQSLEVIVKNNGDDFSNVIDYQNKGISNNGNLGRFVSYDKVTGKVTVAAGIIGAPITYTLAVDTKDAKSGYAIADVLPAGLTYDAASFTATQTTWDAEGLNKTTSPVSFVPQISDNTFTGSLELPASSKTVITYTASTVDEAARVAFEGQLQAAADKVNLVNGGNYNVSIKNTATFGGSVTKDATFSFGGSIAGVSGPDLGGALSKNADWSTQEITPKEDGSLDPPLDITYTINTDLTPFDGTNVLKTLVANVVLSDNLPVQASWKTADATFLTSTGIVLEKVTPVDLTAFAGDEYVGKYFVDGQKLYVNVGMDNTLKSTIAVKAQITTVMGLNDEWTNVPGESKKKLTNRAEWTYTTENGKKTTGYNRAVELLSHEQSEDGFNAPDYFKKESTAKQVTVKPGESTTVGYKFTVGAGKGIDVTKSSIVDYVDSNVFDTSNLEAIKGGLTANYDYWRTLDGSSFDVSLNDAGDLVIKLNDAGIALVNGWGANKQFELNIALTTKPVIGKQTLQITNKATLFGTDGKAMYWSEASSAATSYGDEAEIRKEVRDTPNSAWTQNLRAELSPDGELIQDKFVYNVALIAHGKYTGVEIFDVVDVLPAGIEFLGFVDDANIDDGANPKAGPIDLKGNVQARFDAPTIDAPQGKVVLFQKAGTVLDSSQGEASVNILVKITDFTSDAAIVNSIGSKKASITPSSGYPLSIAKLNSVDDTVAISDETAKFQILNADSSVAVDNVFVQDNALRVLVDGVAKNVTVPKPGTYTVKEIKAPAGYATTEETIEVVVATDGSSKSVSFYNTPIKTYAVGDVVWVDTDKNGLQGEDEFLKDVVVTLLDGTGTPVATTKTDASGWYMFDSLPAGEYQVKFELTPAQQEIYDFTTANSGDDDATDSDADPATGLTPKFTLDDSNKSLTKDYRYDYAATEGIDPTWDAGVVLKPVVEPTPTEEPTTPAPTEEPTTPAPTEEPTTPAPTEEPTTPAPTVDPTTPAPTPAPTTPAPTVDPTTPAPTTPAVPKVSVGDYVWVDNNRNGVQEEGEKGIKDVVLTITGPDGKPVIDVFGKPVGSVTTDENGKYTFENLPVLKEGESYTVTIDQNASKEALAPYIPTKETEGNREGDSSTWTAKSEGLTNDGDRDATLDFGFMTPEVAPTVEPTTDPTVSPTVAPSAGTTDVPAAQTSAPAKGDLASTGFNSISLMLFGLLLALVGGAAVTIVARRRSSARH